MIQFNSERGIEQIPEIAYEYIWTDRSAKNPKSAQLAEYTTTKLLLPRVYIEFHPGQSMEYIVKK